MDKKYNRKGEEGEEEEGKEALYYYSPYSPLRLKNLLFGGYGI
jgi:hypothetical protein